MDVRVRKRTRKKNRRTHGRVPRNLRRNSARSLRRGSLTAEAAIALPLFFFCVLTLISFFEMFRLSMVHTVRLQQEAEELGKAAAIAGSLSGEIDLYESIPWNGGFPALFDASTGIAVRARVRPWTGRGEAETGDGTAQQSGQLVYVTDHQSVYHTDSRCTHLSLSVRQVGAGAVDRLRNNYGEKYHACEKCARSTGAEQVFITPEGNHFHLDAACSGLSRTVRMEKLSDLADLHICSRCAAREGS